MTGPGKEPTAGSLRWIGSRVRDILRWEGARGPYFRALAWVGYRSGGWYVRPLDEPLPPVERRADVELRTLSKADLEAYLAFRRGATKAQFLERLHAGNACFAARRGDEIGSVTWVSTDTARMETLALDLPLEAGEVYLYDSFSTPRVRGQRMQATICAAILERYRAAGFERAVTIIGPENRPNIASRTRSGFRRTGTLVSIHIGPVHRHYFRGQRSGAEHPAGGGH